MPRQSQTRDRLVLTAAELFWNQGYAQTGVSSIMKRARATSGSFYHFFPTKEDLLLAVFDVVSEQLEAEVLDKAEDASGDLMRRLSTVVEAYRGRMVSTPIGFGIPVGRLVGELGPDHAAARRRLDEILQSMVSRIAGWLVGSDGGRLGKTDQWRLAEFIVASLEGSAVMACARGTIEPLDVCAERLELLVAGFVEGPGNRADGMPMTASSDEIAVDWKSW